MNNFNALRVAVLAILENAGGFGWSVQGFGVLRLFVGKVGRVHVWHKGLRYPNVSMVHNHSWDLKSTVVSGRLNNVRYAKSDEGHSMAKPFDGTRLLTGFDCKEIKPLPETWLREKGVELYTPGMEYAQKAAEIHRTDAEDGTVSVMLRNEVENGEADVYWPRGTEWGTAQPRPATEAEIKLACGLAIEKLTREMARR